MKLILKNIGLLKKAEIILHPLCVIAGENDNGKSTVGKIVFCIVKAINRYKEDLKVSKSYEISELLRQAFFDLRRVGANDNAESERALRRLRMAFVDDSRLDDLMQTFEEVIVEHYSSFNLSKEARNIIEKLEDEVRAIASEPEDSRSAIEQAFNKVFTAEFDSEVLLVGATEGHVQLWEGETCLIDLKIDAGNKVTLLNEVEPIEFKDATFVETPLILNFHDVLLRSQTLLEINKEPFIASLPYTTLHTKDLFNKLKQPDTGNYSEIATSLSSEISHIISGRVGFSRDARDFVFEKEGKQISIKNTASGIKAFGLLQVLLANDFLNKNYLLILDEPENHLHPKWQIKLAEILVLLAKNDIFVVVSAHSPYMIEALERYSEKYNIKDKSGFYLARNREIENKNNLEEIFSLLSEPFTVFEKMDAEALRDE